MILRYLLSVARYRTKVVEPAGQYHSDDPRQADLFSAEATPATAGRPAVGSVEADSIVVAAMVSSVYAKQSVRTRLLIGGSVDQIAEEIRRVTGSGPRLNWCGTGDYPASTLVRVDWQSSDPSSRFGYFRDARTALLCVLEYEETLVARGREAAELFRDKARCRTESEAVARMDEEDGVVREDPNRNNPKYRQGDT